MRRSLLRCATVRGSTAAQQFTINDLQQNIDRVTVQWIGVDGVLESAAPNSRETGPAGVAEVGGRPYPLDYDIDFPNAAASGSVVVENKGVAESYPVVRIFGPVDDPVVSLIDAAVQPSKSLGFVGLSIAANDYLELDLKAHTALYNGNPLDNRFGSIDFASSSWWRRGGRT